VAKIEIFRPTSGSYDVTVLQQYASSPENYFGRIVYIAKLTGSVVTVEPFVRPGTFYFNENGTWHSSPFELEPDTSGFDG
jgi:hypothetical protein